MLTRVAAFDCGTNSLRVLVADLDAAAGTEHEVLREMRIVRLGEGVDRTGRISDAAMTRVLAAVDDFARLVRDAGATAVRFCATSAARDAGNAADFMTGVRERVGVEPEVLGGLDEARASYAGATRSLADAPGPRLVVDIGGGSTELVLGDFHVSLAMGSVRFTERHGEDVAALEAAARQLLPELEPTAAAGVAGTITTLAALDLGLPEYDRTRVDGHLLGRDGARAQLERLAALTLEERRRVPALEPERAPVIVAGAAILVAILDRYGLDGIRASERDLLDGAAFAAAELPEPEEGAAPPGAYTCC